MSDSQGDVPILADDGRPPAPKKRPPKGRYDTLVPTWVVVTLFLGSALAVGFVFYVDVVRLGPNNKGLVVRGDRLVSVYEPGQVAHKIPFIERVIDLDVSPRPLPAVRLLARTTDDRSVRVELVLVFRYVDATKVWEQWQANDFRARGVLEKELRQLITTMINTTPSAALLDQAGQTAWLDRLRQDLTARWAAYGIEIVELRTVELRVRGPSR